MDQYIRKQDGVHLSGIQMGGISGIQMEILKPDHLASNLFDHLNTEQVWYSDLYCFCYYCVLLCWYFCIKVQWGP